MIKQETGKHNQLMVAAAALFSKQGYKKTTVDEIIVRARVSKGLFYHYYKNKKELYIHLYNTYVDIFSNDIRTKIDTSETDFFKRLLQVAHIRINFITEYPDLWDFLYSAYYEEHTDIAHLVKEKNGILLRESYISSAANIDWSKLRRSLTPDRAMEIVVWVAEGFARKVASSQIPLTELHFQFDEYVECLKSGMYEGGD